MKKSLIFFILIFLCPAIFCQSIEKEKISSKELITISKDTNLNEAITAIEVMTQKFEGRKIVNMSRFTAPIGVPITQLYWKDALDLIINFNNLVLEELPAVYIIKDFVIEEKIKIEEKITPDTKQIRISSIFFKADKSVLNSIGIDWSTLYKDEVLASVSFSGGSRVATELFEATGATSLKSGDITIDIKTLFRIIEEHQKGTVIARPDIIVLSGKKGCIQVGQDFSVKTADEAGNVTDRFFSTGIIMEVTPTII